MFMVVHHLLFVLCYSRKIALMLNDKHENKIYFEVQLGLNNWPLEGEKHPSCVEMYCGTDFSHRGVKQVK